MRPTLAPLGLVLALAFAAPPDAVAEPATYVFDTVHSQVHASASHLGFSHSTARFPITEGKLVFDPADWSRASVEATINAAGLDFGDATWNEHMRAAQFFNTAEFPTLTFRSTKASGSGDRGTVEGELLMLGQSHPVVLDVTFNKLADNPFSKKPTVGFSATASLKRSEWGMNAYVPSVGDEVTIRIEVEAGRAD
jgi:polyisoprenoid-binding protein YceI